MIRGLAIYTVLFIGVTNDNGFYYNTTIYIESNLIGTGNRLKDVAYSALCDRMNCYCCIGQINQMRCGIPLICEAITSHDESEHIQKLVAVICGVIGSLWGIGVSFMTFGFHVIHRDHIFGNCMQCFGSFCIVFGFICAFPFSLLVICYGKCPEPKQIPWKSESKHRVHKQPEGDVPRENDNNIKVNIEVVNVEQLPVIYESCISRDPGHNDK
jgi:hypothetical protein